MLRVSKISRTVGRAALLLPALFTLCLNPSATAQAPAAAATTQRGTVKSIAGNTVTLKSDAGPDVKVTIGDGIKVLQLPVGSTDLKTATPGAVTDIAVGDRVLVSGKAGDAADQFTASRVVLMKSGDIAQKRAQEQADWQKRGSGGLVSAVDPASGTLTVAVGAKKVAVKTSGSTIYRRYSGGSVKFEDAVPGTLAQLQVGDQLRVRGAKSDDGSSIQAEEIVSGSFTNVAGVIASINAADGSITLKDLTTKKTVTVKVTASSDLRSLPERTATMLAARAKGGAAGAAPGAADGGLAAAGGGEGSGGGRAGGGATGGGRPGGGPGAGAPGGGGRGAGADLAQMFGRLPTQTMADLKTGEAVMIVASTTAPSSTTVTAVTLLTGVEPILAASPEAASMTFSGWSVGGGAPE
jgi:Domain of unknown function (DUF5666)